MNDSTKENIKPKIVFDTTEQAPLKPLSETAATQSANTSNTPTTATTPSDKHVFTANDVENFQLLTTETDQQEAEGELEGRIYNTLRPKRSLWRKAILLALGIFGVSVIAQGVHWMMQAWQMQDRIGLGMGCAGGLVVIAALGTLIGEWRKLQQLKTRTEERDIAKQLLSSHGLAEGKKFCEEIAAKSSLPSNHPAIIRWQQAIHETHSDKEVVELYARMVQPVIDSQVKREINRYSAESAVMIAVSPLAFVDMAFIAWRNIALINRIAKLNGIELGYYSRIRLFRLVLINIAFAGASELIGEVGMDWMSQDLVAKLSTRAAQGVGAGLLTARLGIKTMELCRPLPWLDDKPRLADFRKELIKQLKLAKSDR